MISKFINFVNESVGNSKNLKEDLLKSESKLDFKNIIRKTFITVDDLDLLDSTKDFLKDIGFQIDRHNMDKKFFCPNEGFGTGTNGGSSFIANNTFSRWGYWKKIKDSDWLKIYYENWDYHVKITEFADMINSFQEYSIPCYRFVGEIIVRKEHITRPDVDPYGEEDWD